MNPMSDSGTGYTSSRIENGVLVLSVEVDQLRDTETSYALRDEIIARLAKSESNDVVVDLRPVEFVNSIGLVALLALRKHVPGRIVLCNVSDFVANLLQLCRLTASDPSHAAPFEVQENLKAALARVSG
jgi:anti-anti-sigma factor